MNSSKTLSLFNRFKPFSKSWQQFNTLSAHCSNFKSARGPVTSKCMRIGSVNLNNKFNSVIANTKINNRCASGIGVDDSEGPLTKSQAGDLVLRLTEEERIFLTNALQEFEANKVKSEYEGQLATTRWRSRFGRPSKLPTLGDVDPTGTYCHLSEDWLKKKYAENVPPPTFNQLVGVGIHNAIPFVGFGFLDNFIMIIAGDYIELSLGSVITISTMAAAALGNTISDVMGIGSAWYVEFLASKVGLKPPNLSPIQLDMKSARRFANLGRAIGIVIGCLLGMIPLIFMKSEKIEGSKTEESEKLSTDLKSS